MILRRYMTRQVASTTALVVGFLIVLLLGGRMIRYFGIAAEGRLDVGLLMSLIGYNVPYFLELILPLSFFIGLMLVFGRLYVDSEMAVLNSSGVSRGQLARLMTPLIIALFVMEAGLSLYAKPWGVGQADSIWQQQSLNSAFDLVRPQSFISSDDYHLYVGSMSEDRSELQDVILIQTEDASSDSNVINDNLNDDDNTGNNIKNNAEIATATGLDSATGTDISAELQELSDSALGSSTLEDSATKDVIVLAKRAVQVQGADNENKTQLDLYQGRRYQVDADSLAFTQISFERYRISINSPPTQSVTEDNVTTQKLPVLWQAATGKTLPLNDTSQSTQDAQNKQHILTAQAELGYRFTLPWLMIIAPMLAVPLAQVRPRQGRWIRLLPAIIIFVSCVMVVISLKNPVISGRLHVWVYPFAILSFMMLALYLNWASRIHHRVRFGLHSKNGKNGRMS